MYNNQLNTNQPSPSDDSPEMERDIIQDSWRQARFSANATLGFIIASAVINILGIGLLFCGKVPEGTITTASGLTTNIVSLLVMLNKENNDRLDRLAKEFQHED
ncbi:TRADD-N-associated membrane domain-containing protein [Microseira wollei]|uniref:Cyanobacterial TRADD-N associated 2 transmembrane domain-containing protein n=1 Tax=Microseira wollei NIES-4236 TaxID=2530354 RepID=A0AAV3X8H7_9CYAN|nr:hypothetical protein [Microseira wollei]GET36370.1 hypothetical protein MiSe_11190 [Microseira wollei NIES-4236]